jgi:hypothetical protein
LAGLLRHSRNKKTGKFICGWHKNSAQRQEMASATALRATSS